MQVRAHARYIRMSPRKVRLVVDLVRGKDVVPAIQQLTFTNKAASLPVKKVIESAVANAEHNNKLQRDNLFISQIMVNQGPTLQRWLPRAFGRATPLRKRSCHISVVLDERVPTAPAADTAKDEQKITRTVVASADDVADVAPAEAVDEEKEQGAAGGKRRSRGKGFAGRVFNRKAG